MNKLGRPKGPGFWPAEQIQKSMLAKSARTVSGCLIWQGGVGSAGYGKAYDGTKVRDAHRIAFAAFVGEIPEGLCVCHTCDVRLCIEPAHLFLGTKSDNSKDCAAKGRNYSQTHPHLRPRGPEHVARVSAGAVKGEGHPKSKLNDDAVRDIRSGGDLDELAAKYGVCTMTIRDVRRLKTWRHVA